MSRKRSREPSTIDFEETTESITLREFGPRRCRHVRDGDRPYRQLYVWAARRDDVIRNDRDHLILCITCASMLEDFSEVRAEWGGRLI